MTTMRPLPVLTVLLAVAAVATLAGCGTKTPLKLPPLQQAPVSGSAGPTSIPATASKAAESGR